MNLDDVEVEGKVEKVEEVDGAEEPGVDDAGPDEEEEPGDAPLTVQIGDEAPEEEEESSPVIRDMRKLLRDKDRRIKELEGATETRREKPVKPTMDDCDYDTSEYERRTDQYLADMREYQAEEEKGRKRTEEAESRWQERQTRYTGGKAKLAVKDFDDAEDVVRDVFSTPFPGLERIADMRFNMVLQGAKDSSLLIYALGKNPAKARELAAIEDPTEFAMALGRMEASVKTSRKPATEPEGKAPSGTGTGAGSGDRTLDKLIAEADKTGDRSKVVAYKRKMKSAA